MKTSYYKFYFLSSLVMLLLVCGAASSQSMPEGQLVAQHSGQCLDIVDSSRTKGALVVQWPCNSRSTQRWRFEPTETKGVYFIVSVFNNLVLDVEGDGLSNGVRIYLWEKHGGANQKWGVTKIKDDIYVLRGMHSDKCLDISEISQDHGAKAQQWDYLKGANQQWELRGNPEPLESRPQPRRIRSPAVIPEANFTEVFYGGKSTLGRGFNMFADTKTEETTLPLVLFDPKTTARQIYGQRIEVPNNINYNPLPETEFSSDLTASYNAAEAQDTLQQSLGILGRYRGVTASVAATYGTDSLRQSGTSFVEYKVRISAAILSFRPGGTTVLAPGFQKALEQFRDANAAGDRNVQDHFFHTYGTHYVQQVSLGAACTMVARLSHSANLDKEEIGVAAKASFDGKVFSASVESDTKVGTLRKRFESNSRTTFTAAGGEANIIVTGGQNGRINSSAYNDWVSSTRIPGNLSDVERRVLPIWELSPEANIQTNLKSAFEAYAARKSRELDTTKFNKQVIGYRVEVTLERIQVDDDNDAGADQGDLFWLLWLDRPEEFGGRVTLSEVNRDSSISIASGDTRFFRDLVPNKNALTQTFTVKPGAEFTLGGRVSDADSGLNGGDDLFGDFTQSVRAPTRGTNLLPLVVTARLNTSGDVTLFYIVRYTAVF